MIGLQITIVFVGDKVFDIDPDGLYGPQWAISILVAAFSLPWGVVVRFFPDEWFAWCVYLVAPPFVVCYRYMAKGFRWFGGLFKRSEKDFIGEEGNSGQGTAKDEKIPAPPPIFVDVQTEKV